jgi:diguanylate cyclase (GGDEF)-like protein/PAS domain S-box-containing protein
MNKVFSSKNSFKFFVGLYIAWVCLFSLWSYQQEKSAIYSNLDQQLESAALALPFLLPDEFHNQGMSKGQISSTQDMANIQKLSDYIRGRDIIYIYSLIRSENKIIFTSSSATDEELSSNEGLSYFFDEYDDVDPRVHDVFLTNSKQFIEYKDKWGHFRSVFIPQYAKDGQQYVVVADIEVSHIQNILHKNILNSLFTALLFVLIGIPLFLTYTRNIRKFATDLNKQVKERTQALEENNQELAESESRLQEAQKYAQLGYWELSIDRNTALWSEQIFHMFGLPLTEKPGPESLYKVINKSDFPSFKASIEESFNTGREHHVEYRIQRLSDGAHRWIECRGKVIKDEAGTPLKISGFIQDITAQKQNEQVLRVLAESGASGNENIFRLMVEQLAISQGTGYALIAQTSVRDVNVVDTIAVWANGRFMDNFSYNLEGTPCKNVLQQDICFYPKGIQQQFPSDHLLADMNAESYIGMPLKNSKGDLLGLIAILDDKPMSERAQITALLNSLSARASIELERKATHQKLELSSRVFHDTHEGIVVTDSHCLIVDVNPAFYRATGYSRDEVIGKNPKFLNSGKQSPEFYEDMWQQINEQDYWQGEIWNRKKDGEIFAELLTISVLRNEDNVITNYIGVFTDITDSKRQQERLSMLAHYDVLTKLPNRALFTDRFHQAIAHSKRSQTQLAVVFVDIDNFKPVNDRYGHEAGDKLLVEVAERIKANIREEDTVSRIGGDEFTILLNDITSIKQCEKTLTRIHTSLTQPLILNGDAVEISASSGVTIYPSDDEDIDTLLRHADQAMYQAKLAGKGHYQLFNPEQNQQTILKHSRLEEIERALSNDEFELYYQPKVNMKTGVVYGAEALIRWNHPEKGLILPLEFLPIICETKLEIAIGNWVINGALQQLDDWLEQGIELEVSINIASHHLLTEAFYSELDKALALHPAVDSKQLQLEILESSALNDIRAISSIVKTCQEALGVNVALDDFGTGYSSLTHLRNLSADVVKIDQSFIRDLLDDPEDYAITDGIIGLADSFNRKVIAEGVETTEHGLMLLVMGCEEAQGYGIARPLPAQSFLEWFEQYSPNVEWLACGQRLDSPRESKCKQLKLLTERWIQRLTSAVNSSPETNISWPILRTKHCHCGSWISQARKSDLFSDEMIEHIVEVHNELHKVGNQLYSQYESGDIETARSGLYKLDEVYEKMKLEIAMCE